MSLPPAFVTLSSGSTKKTGGAENQKYSIALSIKSILLTLNLQESGRLNGPGNILGGTPIFPGVGRRHPSNPQHCSVLHLRPAGAELATRLHPHHLWDWIGEVLDLGDIGMTDDQK